MRRWSTSLTHARSEVFHESDVHTNVMYTFVHTQPERGMDYQRFEWDDAKAESNLRKTGSSRISVGEMEAEIGV